MSGFSGHRGRNHHFSSNCFQGQQYSNFDSQYNSVSNAYEQEYSDTGDNSYSETFQEGLETGTSYWQDDQYVAGADYATDAYQDNGNVYGYEEQSTESVDENHYTQVYEEASYEFESDTHENQSHYHPQPVSDYHSFSVGNSNFAGRGRSSNLTFRGSANRSRGQFNNQNRGQPVNHFARRGFGDSYDRGRGRGPRRGSGQFNLNRNQFQQPKPGPKFGQFTENKKASEKGQFDALEGNKMGQFGLSRNEGSSTERKDIEGHDCKGQFGLTKESLKQETSDAPTTRNSNDEQPSSERQSSNKINSEQQSTDKVNSEQLSTGQTKSEQLSTDQAKSEQLSTNQAKSEQPDNEQHKSEQLMQKEVTGVVNTEETTKEESDNEEESDSSDEDTDFCKYCKLNFSTPKAYHAHTRGLQHTTLVMEAKANKGDKHYRKEEVEASVLEVYIPKPKPEKTESDECIDNWRNLDDDVTNYVKDWMNPENKDLNPSDVGKSPVPDEFNCALCNIKCTGPGAFKMHIDGKTHRNNIEAARHGDPFNIQKITKFCLLEANVYICLEASHRLISEKQASIWNWIGQQQLDLRSFLANKKQMFLDSLSTEADVLGFLVSKNRCS